MPERACALSRAHRLPAQGKGDLWPGPRSRERAPRSLGTCRGGRLGPQQGRRAILLPLQEEPPWEREVPTSLEASGLFSPGLPLAGGVPYELHACPWAQACAQFQQLQPTHHRFASHAGKKPTRFNHVRNKLLSPPLAPDHGTSVNDVGGCGAEKGSGGGRQALQLSWLVGQPGQSGTGAGFRSWRVSWESPAPAAVCRRPRGSAACGVGKRFLTALSGSLGHSAVFMFPLCRVPFLALGCSFSRPHA